MNKKQIFLLILVAVIFGVGGVALGRFVKLPFFDAATPISQRASELFVDKMDSLKPDYYTVAMPQITYPEPYYYCAEDGDYVPTPGFASQYIKGAGTKENPYKLVGKIPPPVITYTNSYKDIESGPLVLSSTAIYNPRVVWGLGKAEFEFKHEIRQKSPSGPAGVYAVSVDKSIKRKYSVYKTIYEHNSIVSAKYLGGGNTLFRTKAEAEAAPEEEILPKETRRLCDVKGASSTNSEGADY